jgi:hypothetical protein
VTSITRPSPVAVAQNRDMAGQFGFRGLETLPQPHLVEPVHRLLETSGNDLHEN